MKIQLTKEHVRKAIEAATHMSVDCCCPVFQAISDAGIPVTRVSYLRAWTKDYLRAWIKERPIELPSEARRVTAQFCSKWPGIQPFEFEIDYEPA